MFERALARTARLRVDSANGCKHRLESGCCSAAHVFFPHIFRSERELGREGTAQKMVNREEMYPHATREIAEHRSRLAPAPAQAFGAFSESVFAEGATSAKTKQLIAVAVAHVTQCPYCIRGHTRAALRQGATPEEIMEAVWVAAEMRAGGAYAHSALALDEIAQHRAETENRTP